MISSRIFIITVIVFAWCLAGCDSQETGGVDLLLKDTATPSETALASPANTVFSPTLAPATLSAAPQEPSPAPSATPSPTLTPQPTSTPTETPIPSSPVGSISLAPVLEGVFTRPLYLTHAGDDRLFIVEEAGLIRIISDGKLLDEPYLDIRDRVNSVALERGLLGLAFPPDYGENGFFYVNYSNSEGDTHISRFSVDPTDADRADPTSEQLLLLIDQPLENHNGGQVAFGPDGFLYVGVGDGGGANDTLLNGQNPTTLLGTILRLDVDSADQTNYAPETNPFVSIPDRPDEIWAWGLRNPWRFSFDRVKGDLFIADVGQNLWEEVHFQPSDSPGGENYGWNILEGSHCFQSESCDSNGLEFPIFEYAHLEGCSITGGYMYRGSQFPGLYGNYFAGDYCQGKIWRLFRQESGEWLAEMVLDSDYVISSFGEDAKGELYVLDHVGGSVFQIRP